MNEYNILVVDDEKYVLRAVKRGLRKVESLREVDTTQKPEEALENLTEKEYAVVLSDFQMPGMNGVQFLKKIRETYPAAVRIIITGNPEQLKEDYPNLSDTHLVYMAVDKTYAMTRMRELVEEAIMVYEKQKADLPN